METISLCDICTPKQWPTLSIKELSGSGFPVYGANGIIGYHSTYNHEKPTILIGCRGSCGQVSICAEKSYVNGNAMCLDNLSDDIISKFLFYFLENYDFRKVITGTSQPQITRESLRKVRIPIISLQEQMDIATTLDKVTDLISLRKQQLAKLDELVRSRFIEMFGDPIHNPLQWNTKPLLEMGYCKNGMNFHTGDRGIKMRCLGVGDFKDFSVIDGTNHLPTISLNEVPPEESMLQDGDIVFVRSNGNKALVGRCLIIYPHNTPTTYSGFCIRYRLTSDEINTVYLLRVLKTESMRKKMTGRGANIQNLNQQILATLNIPIPPTELQEQFAVFVEQTDKSRSAVQQSLEQLETLKRSLMQEYFG